MNKALVFSAVISAMLLAACSKEKASQPEDGHTYYQSATVVKKGQTVNVGIAPGSWTGEWTVTPNEGTMVFAKDQWAEILFTQPGRYTITAKTKNNGPVHTDTVRVVDSVYAQPAYSYPEDLAANEIITLQPLSFQYDVLVFYARAKYSYSCIPILVYQNNSSATEVKIDFVGVPGTATALCTPGPYPSPSSLIYTQGYELGTHDVVIRMGKSLTPYTGTLTVTEDKYIFNWPDNIPVVIAPKEINRVK